MESLCSQFDVLQIRLECRELKIYYDRAWKQKRNSHLVGMRRETEFLLATWIYGRAVMKTIQQRLTATW